MPCLRPRHDSLNWIAPRVCYDGPMEQARPKHASSPQAKEMADESMVRNLAAQAEAIWPQEAPIFARHPVDDGAILDLGCGTGEIAARIAEMFT